MTQQKDMTQQEDAKALDLGHFELVMQDAGLEPLDAHEAQVVADFLGRGWQVAEIIEEIRKRRELGAAPDIQI